MFDPLKINHSGLHRIAIVVGVFFFFISAWLTAGIFDGGNFYQLTIENLIYLQQVMWKESGESYYIPLGVYLIFYLVGYFLIYLIYWIIEGFKKNNN